MRVASLIEPCGRADGVSVGNLVVAVPHVGDAGPFSGGPLAGSRTKACPQRVQAEEGDVEREMRIPKSGQVEGIATEVDSHLDVSKISVPPLILGRDPMSAQHLLQLLTESLGLAREVLQVRGAGLVVEAVEPSVVLPKLLNERRTLVRMDKPRARLVS